jgi:hypothetical protein
MNNPEAQETLGTRHIMKTQQKKTNKKDTTENWKDEQHEPPLNTYISNMDLH